MENQLEIKTNREYILAGDISMSMTYADPLCGGRMRYDYMLEKFKSFIKIAEDLDQHGAPTVMLFGENVKTYEHLGLDKVDRLLSNVVFEGFTNLHLALNAAFNIHRDEKVELANAGKVHPGTILIVFTDGDPSNPAAVKRSLSNIVNAIDREEEFQIIFLTVGTVTPDLNKYLEGLHNDLEDKAINPRDFDIIHVEKLEETAFTDTLSLNRHK